MAGPRFSIDVDVRGLAAAISQINQFDLLTKAKVKDVVNKHALNIQKGAKRRVKVDTGRLRSSIAMEPYMEGMAIRVGTNVKYAPYVEHGTGKFAENGNGRKKPWMYKNRDGQVIWTQGQKPQPFLHPAANEEKAAYIKDMKRVLKGVSP